MPTNPPEQWETLEPSRKLLNQYHQAQQCDPPEPQHKDSSEMGNNSPKDKAVHSDRDLPDKGDERIEPQPPSCEKDTTYLGYRGKFAFHKCSCCGRIYAVDAYENTKQFERDNGILVLHDTKTHAQISSTVSIKVRR
jgi:hypothetical protein